MKKKILAVMLVLFTFVILSGCLEAYEPEVKTSSPVKPYMLQDRGNGSYLIEPVTVSFNNIPVLLLGYDEINKKCNIIAFSGLSAPNGGIYGADSTVAILVKVSSCSEKVNAISR